MRTMLVGLSLALVASSCAHPPHLRVATATPAEFQAAAKEHTVWYEFQPGDRVPFNLLYFGAIQGGARGIGVIAKKPFYVVSTKNGPLMLSYDGESISQHQIRSIIAVTPNDDGVGGQVSWMTYLGEAADPEAELEKLFQTAKDE